MPIEFSDLSVQQSLPSVLAPILGSHCMRIATSPELEGGGREPADWLCRAVILV